MSLREHLSELKHRFKITFTSFVVILAALLVVPEDPAALLSGGYNSFRPLIGFFIQSVDKQLLPPTWTLIAAGGLSEPLEIYLVASVLFALIFNGPIFAYEVIRFISPALNERERRLIYPFVGAASGLFAFGVVFGYLFLAKFLLVALSPFFITTKVSPFVDAGSFYFTVFLTIAMAGFAFTVPVYVYTLIDFGVIQAAAFRKNRLVIWAVTYIATAIITPDGGPLLDVILFLPLVTLLEIAVFLGGRSRANALKKQGASERPSEPAPSAPPTPSTTTSLPAPIVVPAPATQRVCAYCKNYLAPGVVFCPNCGRAND
jgi:Tat protein translocase TatC